MLASNRAYLLLFLGRQSWLLIALMAVRLTRVPSVLEVEYQRPAKSYTALQTIRHRFNIYVVSCIALAL